MVRSLRQAESMQKSYQYPLAKKPPHRRRSGTPNLVPILAIILILGGLAVLGFWLTQPGKPLNAMFATDTPTPTLTLTPTITPLPSETPTITATPTQSATATPSAPFSYTVREGDSLFLIAERFSLGQEKIKLIMFLNPCVEETGGGICIDPDSNSPIVFPGLLLTIPNPGMEVPTATPIPANVRPGTKIEYTVESGDNLSLIASKFNSTEEAIIKENDLTDPNAINVGQLLIIPVNLVTPTATRPPTSTPSTPVTPTQTP